MFNNVNFELVSEKSYFFYRFQAHNLLHGWSRFQKGLRCEKGREQNIKERGFKPSFLLFDYEDKKILSQLYFLRYILSGALKVIKKSGMQR